VDYNSNIPYNLEFNDKFMKKRRWWSSMRLADVKGSELARAIDPKLAAVNLFAHDEHEVYSERVDGTCYDTALARSMGKWYTDGVELKDLPHIHDGFTRKDEPQEFIADLKLKKYLTADDFHHNKSQQAAFVEQWLLAESLGILDYWHENNFPFFYDTKGNMFIGKAFDFECCMHIISNEAIHWLNPIMFDAYREFEKGLSVENAKYLRAVHPKTTKNFFDKLLKVDIDSICDFSKVTVHPYSDELSEQATKGYKSRFRMLADQYTKYND
jgi:hypothetical protein